MERPQGLPAGARRARRPDCSDRARATPRGDVAGGGPHAARLDLRLVKPAVSAGAEGAGVAEAASFDALVAAHDVLVQPLVPSLAEKGERSLFFFDDGFSHAVDRRPGTTGRDLGRAARAGDDEIALARRTIAAARACTGSSLLYARVDLARMPDGAAALVELEAIEPSMFFAHEPEARGRLAAAVARAVAV